MPERMAKPGDMSEPEDETIKIWIVWRTPVGIFATSTKKVELVTFNEERAMKLAASSPYMYAEAVEVEDMP